MRMRPFAPSVVEIPAGEAGDIRGLGAVLSYWTEGVHVSPEGWFEEVLASWGPAGFAMRRGEEVTGFAVYGPRRCLPRAGRYPAVSLGEDDALLAYLEGDDARTRRHLLARVMRDLRLRGFERVEAIASDAGLPRHVPTRFLAESGWEPVRGGWHAGLPYTPMRADFGSTVVVGELARAFVGRVRLPVLERRPAPASARSLSKVVRAAERRS